MSCISRGKLNGIETDKTLFGVTQLLVLERADFNTEDLIDYILKSKEYQTILAKNKLEFLDRYQKLAKNRQEFKSWIDRTTSLDIGLVTGTALNKGLQLVPVKADHNVLGNILDLIQINSRYISYTISINWIPYIWFKRIRNI